jgi:hypothetical protein
MPTAYVQKLDHLVFHPKVAMSASQIVALRMRVLSMPFLQQAVDPVEDLRGLAGNIGGGIGGGLPAR